jgi:hypothetical protein
MRKVTRLVSIQVVRISDIFLREYPEKPRAGKDRESDPWDTNDGSS